MGDQKIYGLGFWIQEKFETTNIKKFYSSCVKRFKLKFQIFTFLDLNLKTKVKKKGPSSIWVT